MYECLPFITSDLLKEQSVGEILKCNEETSPHQLILTKEDAILLIDTRKEALSATQRIEIGGGVISKIIHAFCTSPYISQYNYASTISELIDTFYYFKNETLEEISDDDMIDLMKELFDQKCHGSIELLQGKELERVAHNIRFGGWDFDREESGEESDDGEW